MQKRTSVETLLIGAGPIGIQVAIELKRASLSYRQIEAGNIGSTIHWYAPGTLFFSSPERLSLAGIPFEVSPHTKGTREEYLTYLRGVVKAHDLPVERYRRCIAIRPQSARRFECDLIRSTKGVGGPEEPLFSSDKNAVIETVVANNIIFAVGDMHRPRMLNVPGEDSPHVSHFFTDPHLSSGMDVVVVGGKNSAVEAIVRLSRVTNKLTLCHRNSELSSRFIKPWLMPEITSLKREGRLKVISNSTVTAISNKAISLAVNHDASPSQLELSYERLFLLTGFVQDGSLMADAGVLFEGHFRVPRHDPLTLETNVTGVFVAGTACAGTQARGPRLFIENCHDHGRRIVAALKGYAPLPLADSRPAELQES